MILALLFTVLPAGELLAAMRRLPLAAWGLAIATYLSLHLIGVVKWRLLANAAGAGLRFVDAVRAYYSGLFGNTFLPSIVGGDVVRAGVAFGVVRSRSGLVLGSLVDRVQDVIGLGLLAGAGVLLSPRALAALAAWFLFPARRLPFRWRRRFIPVRRAVRATAAQPSRLVAALLLGMGLQSLLIVLNWVLGRAIGIDLPL